MALSRKDYEDIIQSAKAVKQIEKEIAEMVAKGVDKSDENFKLKKKQLEVDKARLSTLRSGNEELESEYKAADKLFKLSSNAQREILSGFQVLNPDGSINLKVGGNMERPTFEPVKVALPQEPSLPPG